MEITCTESLCELLANSRLTSCFSDCFHFDKKEEEMKKHKRQTQRIGEIIKHKIAVIAPIITPYGIVRYFFHIMRNNKGRLTQIPQNSELIR